mmetsp:Transcript_27991/g.46515  ORF Transcript_27991/g.46515 Transcript_27991/m.46515 type:complete len:82 (-) Transcript_27991:950-1195(-)
MSCKLIISSNCTERMYRVVVKITCFLHQFKHGLPVMTLICCSRSEVERLDNLLRAKPVVSVGEVQQIAGNDANRVTVRHFF